jgi:hypothetical protein
LLPTFLAHFSDILIVMIELPTPVIELMAAYTVPNINAQLLTRWAKDLNKKNYLTV